MRKNRKRAIGYIRVSTPSQGETDTGLERQTAEIKSVASAAGFDLIAIYEDVGTGMGPNNLVGRTGLEDVLIRSTLERLPVIVSDTSRLTRDAITLAEIIGKKQVRILTLIDGVLADLSGKEYLGEIAQRQGAQIAEGTRRALADLKASGKKLGNLSSLPVAQANSKRVRSERAHDVVLSIADYIDAHPQTASMTAPEMVDALNAAGVKTGWGRSWTVSGLRRPLADARKEIAARRELDADTTPFSLSTANERTITHVETPADEQIDHYKSIPGYGRF